MFESIPNSLKYEALWCGWKKTDRGKVPYDLCKGTLAKSNDKTTFYPFITALKYAHNYIKVDDTGAMLGGLGLGMFNGFSAIDIDHCVKDGEISSMAQEIIDYCQSYTEYSPSGTGIRIIFKTKIKKFDKAKYYTNNSKIGLEIYIEGATSKFVTITGNTLLNSDIAEVDVKYLLDKYMLKSNSLNGFIEKDKKLNSLWNSQASGSGGNESETDLALCSKLAFYLQKDFDKIEAAFESSPYFQSKDQKHKDKWLVREDYRLSTINKAIDSCEKVYAPAKRGTYGLNDTGNAHRFASKYMDDIHYNVDNKMWMTWANTNWQFDVFGNIKNYAEILCEEMKMEAFSITDTDKQKEYIKNINRILNSSGKEAMLKEAQHLDGVPVSNDMFDKNDFVFNCINGVLDLKTGKLHKHDKKMLLNKISDITVSSDEPKLFLKFLNEVFDGDQDIINYLHKVFGYTLTGSTREQKMWMFVGDGSNGKSLLLQIIQEVMGDYAATSSVELLLDKKMQTSNMSEVARLKGIRMVVTGESKLGDKLNESAIKSLTSGNDKITARFLYGNEFEFLPKMKIFMATNHEPVIRGTDNGIWRRIVKIPFKKVFTESEQDKNLIYKLREEKSQILGWLVKGCMLWQKEGLTEPDILKNEIKAYRTEMDLVQRWADECCEIDDRYIEKASDLFESFKNYCIKNNEYLLSQTLFGRNFSKKYRKERYRGTWCYFGIRVKYDKH